MMDTQAFIASPKRFRVWDGKRMHTDVGDWLLMGSGVVGRLVERGSGHERQGSGLAVQVHPGAVAAASTGLHDADGAEIFEGDVIEVEQLGRATRSMLVQYHRGGWVAGQSWKEFSEPFVSLRLIAESRAIRARVVGNVFENPKLVEG